MFALLHKDFYIVKEPMRKNCTHQTWRGKQIAVSVDRQLLQDYIDSQPENVKDQFYIESLGH